MTCERATKSVIPTLWTGCGIQLFRCCTDRKKEPSNINLHVCFSFFEYPISLLVHRYFWLNWYLWWFFFYLAWEMWFGSPLAPPVCVAKVDIVVKIQVRNVTLNYSYLYLSLDKWKEVVWILKDTRILVGCLLFAEFWFCSLSFLFLVCRGCFKIVSRLTRPI